MAGDTLPLQHGEPPRTGTYLVYTDDLEAPRFAERKFLMWSEGKWWYLLSDQFFRGNVIGWIGPLPPILKARLA